MIIRFDAFSYLHSLLIRMMLTVNHYNCSQTCQLFCLFWCSFASSPSWWCLWRFIQNLIFCSKSLRPRSTFLFWGKKSSFVWNDPKESKWAQNDPKWPKICYIDHFGSFWTLVDHFGTSATLPCLVIFGPKRASLDPPSH